MAYPKRVALLSIKALRARAKVILQRFVIVHTHAARQEKRRVVHRAAASARKAGGAAAGGWVFPRRVGNENRMGVERKGCHSSRDRWHLRAAGEIAGTAARVAQVAGGAPVGADLC